MHTVLRRFSVAVLAVGIHAVTAGMVAAQEKVAVQQKMVGGGPTEYFWSVPADVVVNPDVLRDGYRGSVPPLWAYKGSRWFGQSVFRGDDGGLYVKNDLSAPHLAGAAGSGAVSKMMGWVRVPYPEGNFGKTGWDMFRAGGLAGWPPDAAAQYRCDHPTRVTAEGRSRKSR